MHPKVIEELCGQLEDNLSRVKSDGTVLVQCREVLVNVAIATRELVEGLDEAQHFAIIANDQTGQTADDAETVRSLEDRHKNTSYDHHLPNLIEQDCWLGAIAAARILRRYQSKCPWVFEQPVEIMLPAPPAPKPVDAHLQNVA